MGTFFIPIFLRSDKDLELKELTEKTLKLLEIENTNEMSKKLFDVVRNNNIKIYQQFDKLIENDLSVDWLQKIFQYYQADRKEKMQDYTPESLADFMGRAINQAELLYGIKEKERNQV